MKAKGMKPQPQDVVSFRLPEALRERAEALIEPLRADAELTVIVGRTATRATVLRLALVEGLKVLERRYKA